MNILHVTPSFFPATYWGGPIWSTKAICDGINALPQMSVRVLTTDAASPKRGDLVALAALPYPVHYARRIAGHSISPGLLAQLPKAIDWADVVHLTGTYSFPTLPTMALARLKRKPVVWSPRGALQATAEWGDAPRRGTKGQFERAAQLLRSDRVVLHVTSQAEADLSVTRLKGIETALIPNSVEIPPLLPKVPSDNIRLIYLGRIHPKKGIEQLLDAMAQLPDHVTLDIFGTGAPEDVAQVKSRCTPRIQMHGHADTAAKAKAFANADLFVLPSHSENFGISVAEALAHGVPVLTTTGTPWQALDAKGCGRCIDLHRADLADEIQALMKCDLPAMGAKGRKWMARDFSSEVMTQRFAQLYASLAVKHEASS
ncbi:glycosyltransferase involved in cell wall biosynthesis [Yoonia maritima]|uniref:Glycosyltransferase involved in cell wall biosynthesis n=1 Tax=Yoonia maritima TaxID=1435347 RepID=A0A2T0W093_9RHOB|nr:glycosyltransferase [Yoonia maritima]PRY78177.1 glycosyltransferase involved in cell wall biosynthesis [Yoonia maritima]